MGYTNNYMCLLTMLFMSLAVIGSTKNPGFRIAVTNKGLEYSKNIFPHSVIILIVSILLVQKMGISILKKKLGSLKIPNTSGNGKTPVGSLDYKLKKYMQMMQYIAVMLALCFFGFIFLL